MIYSDKALSQKLERTEARANADFVETRIRLDPESGAAWIQVGGAYAMFDGLESPLTQTFGLGVFASHGGRRATRRLRQLARAGGMKCPQRDSYIACAHMTGPAR